MKQLRFCFGLLLVLLVLFGSFSGCTVKPGSPIPEFIKLQSGDLIFRRGRSAESHVVLLTDHKSQFSHVGIIYVENLVPYVIHAVPGENKGGPDFIKKEKLTTFLAPEKASTYSIYRSDYSEEINKSAALFANQLYRQKLLFDNKYDLKTDDKLYCTELVLKVFQQATNQSVKLHTTRLSVLIGNIDLIMPGNIIENPHFQPIINY